VPKVKLSFLAKRAVALEYERGAKLIREYSIEAIAERYGISGARVCAIAREHGKLCRHKRIQSTNSCEDQLTSLKDLRTLTSGN
jgi:hypothetical protein